MYTFFSKVEFPKYTDLTKFVFSKLSKSGTVNRSKRYKVGRKEIMTRIIKLSFFCVNCAQFIKLKIIYFYAKK